jgi:hypothetical protein
MTKAWTPLGTLLLLGALLGPGESTAPAGATPPPREHWYRGNTHAHSLWDNGDALPELAAEWYRSRGYDFVAITDHNEKGALSEAERWIDVGTQGESPVTSETVAELRRRFGEDWPVVREVDGRLKLRLKTMSELERAFPKDRPFLLLRGEEIGDEFGGKLIHHNALNVDHILPPPGGTSIRDVMGRALAAAQGESRRTGKSVLVHLNHPNLGWAVGAGDLEAVADERFLEIYNGHPLAENRGKAGHPGMERIWDEVLTARLRKARGPVLYGLATDDAHHYSGRGSARPGRGWVMVHARELSAEALLRSMDAGDFYSSTGVMLSELEAGECGLSVKVAAETGVRYTIRMIGTRSGSSEIGAVLQETEGPQAYYSFLGDELYVRAVVRSDRPMRDPSTEGDLEMAWGQPVVVRWRTDQ